MSTATWIHIYAPQPTATECDLIECPTCERPRRMLVERYEWFGPELTCTGCGDRWCDGEMAQRPFEPAWRKHSRERAIRTLRRAGYLA